MNFCYSYAHSTRQLNINSLFGHASIQTFDVYTTMNQLAVNCNRA